MECRLSGAWYCKLSVSRIVGSYLADLRINTVQLEVRPPQSRGVLPHSILEAKCRFRTGKYTAELCRRVRSGSSLVGTTSLEKHINGVQVLAVGETSIAIKSEGVEINSRGSGFD